MSSCLRILSKYGKKAEKEEFMMKNGAIVLEELITYSNVEYKTLGAGRIRNDRSSNFQPLSWTNRLKIAVEIANAVAYLHVGFTRPIVSKSIKLANILFDEENVAKLFDFTLSEVIPEGETHVNNGIVRGTTGYVALEYAVTGDFNEKSDVFCFGVLLLQLLSGKEYGEKVLCQCVNNTGENYRFDEIIDPIIVGDGLCPEKEYQFKAFSDLAFKCISESAEDRPTMVDVAKQLRQMYLSSI